VSANDWTRIEELYHAALDRAPDERSAFLLEACPNDSKVRRDVESLLAHEGQLDHLLERPAWDHSRPALAPGSIVGTYRIVASLGVGGMGEVYRATDIKLEREVAIKVLPTKYAHDPTWLSRFQREARALALLNHPGIAAIYGIEESGGICALVMELVEGETLAELIARGPIPLAESLRIAKLVGEALDNAHEKGLVHRDLKPANIKITPDGVVKLLDFGLAKASQPVVETDPAVPPTEAGFILGTPAYMSPEQARGHRVDCRTDIWAFGVILWEMLSGRPLFERHTTSDTLAAVLTLDPDFNAVPIQVRRLLRLCMARDTRQRLSHINTALVLLGEEPQPATMARRRLMWLWPAATFLSLLTAALTFIVGPRESNAPDPVVRFQVPLPAKAGFGGHISVSPNGRLIAFSARGADGHTPIWIHNLDKPGSSALPGTNNGGYFFWSPDSRYIAFWADRMLKKVDTAGGPPQEICSTRTIALGGVWRSDGIILFGSADGPLWRVSASGGTPLPITRLDSEADFNQAFPIFLPDGRHLFYHIRSNRLGANAVYVTEFHPDGQLDRGKQVALSQTGAQYVPGRNGKGHLLLLRGTTLMVQEFDEARLQTVGDAHPLLEHVSFRLTYPYFAASGNGVLAWWPDSTGSTSLVWFDRQGNRIGSPLQGEFGDLALAPDGERVAVSQSQGDTDKRDLTVVDLRRAKSTPLTFDAEGVGSPVWSPDGKRIAYSRANFTQVRVRQSSGEGSEEDLTLPLGAKYPVDWSRDGYLLYSVPSQSTQSDLWAFPIDAASADRKPFPYLNTVYREGQGRFSPDGRLVAYVSNETGRDEVWIQQFPAAGGKRQVSTAGGAQPRWRADGRELFFLDDPGRNLMSVTVGARPELRLSAPQRLFDTHQSRRIGFFLFGYDVSRDGHRFLVNAAAPDASPSEINVLLNWQSVKL